MFPIVLIALTQIPDTQTDNLYGHEVLVEQCDRRLVVDLDLDLGRTLLFVQDIATDEVIYEETVDEWVSVTDRADELNLCVLAG